MAKRSHLDTHLGSYEQVCGWLYLPFYLFLLALALRFALKLLDFPLTAFQFQLACAVLNFALTLLLFHRFLFHSLGNILPNFWAFVQAVILGFVFYFAINWVLNWAFSYLAPGLVIPEGALVASMAETNYGATLVCTVLLAPLTEEVLMRGLVFGTIARRSRYLAYLVSILLFAALHLWQYALSISIPELLLCAVTYIPAGLALGWTYEKSGNFWASFLVHAAINAVLLGLYPF